MGGLQDKFGSVKTFFDEVGAEMKKCSWPERDELIESTIVVIVSLVLISLFVGVSDKILIEILRLLIPTG